MLPARRAGGMTAALFSRQRRNPHSGACPRRAFSGTQINAEKHRFSWVFGAKRCESGQISVNLR